MADFLGITKRKWLAFAILAVIFASINAILNYAINEYMLHHSTNFVVNFVPIMIGIFVFAVIADVLLGKIKESFRFKIQNRYIAAFIFALISAWYQVPDPLFGFGLLIFAICISFWFIVSLALYILADFLAGRVLLSSPAKSKQKKSKR